MRCCVWWAESAENETGGRFTGMFPAATAPLAQRAARIAYGSLLRAGVRI